MRTYIAGGRPWRVVYGQSQADIYGVSIIQVDDREYKRRGNAIRRGNQIFGAERHGTYWYVSNLY